MKHRRQSSTEQTAQHDIQCGKCRKTIRQGEKYEVIHKKNYCHKCAQGVKDWEFLEWLAMVEE
ncbi:MAG: hypothetical protein IJH44_05625 [Solobacterium sp.]|nr:hypothetical protein [Solobacterium sp.]